MRQKVRAGSRRSGGTRGALGLPLGVQPGGLTPEDGERRVQRQTRRASWTRARLPRQTSASMEPPSQSSRRGPPLLQLRRLSHHPLQPPPREVLPPRQEERTGKIRMMATVARIRGGLYLAALRVVRIAIAAPDAGARCVGCLFVQSALNHTWLNAMKIATGCVRDVARQPW